MLAITWAVSGCSDSGSSVSDESVSGDSSLTLTAPSTSTANTDSDVSNDPIVPTDPIDAAETELPTDLVGEENTEELVDEPVINSPVVTDPFIQNSIVVDFRFTVPAYQSNELRIDLVWGDINLNAMWVGDEYWSASGEFPTETEELLTVTFYDLNGAMELARFSETFRTGSNATESFQIPDTQFDADQFDTDADGVSNLAELIAGTSPIVDEDSLLDIFDFYSVNSSSRMSVSESFESRLSQERPILIEFTESPHSSSFSSTNINIDSEGNGTLTHNYGLGSETLKLSGTRVKSGNTIFWEATRAAYDGDYRHNVAVTNTVTVVDEKTRTLVSDIEGTNSGTFHFTWDTSTNVTGKLMDGTSLCEAVSGSVSETYRHNRSGSHVTVTTVTKELDDAYWRVMSHTTEPTFVSGVRAEDSQTFREYFVRDLRIWSNNANPDASFFECDFVDI